MGWIAQANSVKSLTSVETYCLGFGGRENNISNISRARKGYTLRERLPSVSLANESKCGRFGAKENTKS